MGTVQVPIPASSIHFKEILHNQSLADFIFESSLDVSISRNKRHEALSCSLNSSPSQDRVRTASSRFLQNIIISQNEHLDMCEL